MTPCSTLEQRWSACRDAVYRTGFDWLMANRACQPINEWQRSSGPFDRRPCTSPRRHQCRAGLSQHGADDVWRWRWQHPGEGRGWWDRCWIKPIPRRDEIDPAVWPRMVERLRRMRDVTDDATIRGPDPGVKGWDY